MEKMITERQIKFHLDKIGELKYHLVQKQLKMTRKINDLESALKEEMSRIEKEINNHQEKVAILSGQLSPPETPENA